MEMRKNVLSFLPPPPAKAVRRFVGVGKTRLVNRGGTVLYSVRESALTSYVLVLTQSC